MTRYFFTFTLAIVIAPLLVRGEDVRNVPAIPQRVELIDQYEKPQVMAFPTTNVTFLTIADRKGSEQIAGWVTAVKARPEMTVDIRGLADVGGVPSFLRGRIRKRFRESILYPVMMDWSGMVCARFQYVPDRANVFIIDRNGALVGRFSGEASESNLKSAFLALEKALATPLNSSMNPPAKKAPTASEQKTGN